jgi:hypothetical protein
MSEPLDALRRWVDMTLRAAAEAPNGPPDAEGSSAFWYLQALGGVSFAATALLVTPDEAAELRAHIVASAPHVALARTSERLGGNITQRIPPPPPPGRLVDVVPLGHRATAGPGEVVMLAVEAWDHAIAVSYLLVGIGAGMLRWSARVGTETADLADLAQVELGRDFGAFGRRAFEVPPGSADLTVEITASDGAQRIAATVTRTGGRWAAG